MDHFSIVNVLHTQANLCKPVQDLIFRKGSAALGLDPPLQVATVTEVHNDAQFASFGLENFDKGDNIGVIKGFQESCLLQRLFLLAL